MLKHENLKIDKINLSVVDNTNKLIYVKYHETKLVPFLFETDYMPIHNNDINNINFVVNLGMEELFNKIDHKIIQECKINRQWSLCDENDKIRYEMILNDTEDNLNIFRVPVDSSIIFFNENKELMEYDSVTDLQNNLAKLILELKYIWFKDNVFGAYIKPHQIKIKTLNHSDYSTSAELILETDSDI
jgi:hypothetical protein